MFKFKGKTEAGEWVIGNYAEFVNYLDGAVRPGIQTTRQVPSSFDRFIPAFETELVEVIPETVSPGVEIDGKWYFAGDKMKDSAGMVFFVDLCGGCFIANYPNSDLFEILIDCLVGSEIIGNKWDNPELEVEE